MLPRGARWHHSSHRNVKSKCKLLISLPELQSVAAAPFSYISLMLSTLTQVSELPSVSVRLPEASSSAVLYLQCSCPLKVRCAANWNVGTVLSSRFVQPNLQFGVGLEQLQNSQPAAHSSPKAGILWQLQASLVSACLEHACSTRSKVIAQECGSAKFSPVFPSLAMSTYLKF